MLAQLFKIAAYGTKGFGRETRRHGTIIYEMFYAEISGELTNFS
jgi:hypothetical protein